MVSLICGINITHMNLYTKLKHIKERNLWFPKEGGINWDYHINIYKLYT